MNEFTFKVSADMSVETELDSLATTIKALRANAEAAAKVAADLEAKLEALAAKLKDGGTAPPPPTEPPAPIPEPPPVPVSRSRDEVTRIIVEEFAKQTSFLPGGGDITSPDKAIQLWTTNFIDNHGATTLPEAELRKKIADMVAIDVAKYKWPPPSNTVISGQANMP